MVKLFRLTKFGHQLVDEALKGYNSILAFCEAHKDQKIRGQTFTKFHGSIGVSGRPIEPLSFRANIKLNANLVP